MQYSHRQHSKRGGFLTFQADSKIHQQLCFDLQDVDALAYNFHLFSSSSSLSSAQQTLSHLLDFAPAAESKSASKLHRKSGAASTIRQGLVHLATFHELSKRPDPTCFT